MTVTFIYLTCQVWEAAGLLELLIFVMDGCGSELDFAVCFDFLFQVVTCHSIFSSGPTLTVKLVNATSRLGATPPTACVAGLGA